MINQTTPSSTSLFPENNDLGLALKNAEEFTVGSWLASLLNDNRCDTLYKVSQVALDLQSGIILVQKDYERLERFSMTFNQRYATDYNDCFSTAEGLLRKLKSTMKRHREYYEMLAPKNRHLKKYAYMGIEKSQKPTAGMFGQATKTLFDIEEYPKEVRDLYEQTTRFFAILAKSMYLCIDILREENQIRQDSQRCQQLYDAQKRKVIAELGELIQTMSKDHALYSPKQNPLIAARMKYTDESAFAQDHFHKHTPKELKPLMVLEEIEKMHRNNLTPLEAKAFNNDPDQVMRAKYLLSQILQLLPEEYNRQKIEGKYFAILYRYLQPTNKKLFYQFVETEFKKLHLRYGLVKISEFYTQAKDGMITNEDYQPYRERMDEILAQNNLQKSA